MLLYLHCPKFLWQACFLVVSQSDGRRALLCSQLICYNWAIYICNSHSLALTSECEKAQVADLVVDWNCILLPQHFYSLKWCFVWAQCYKQWNHFPPGWWLHWNWWNDIWKEFAPPRNLVCIRVSLQSPEMSVSPKKDWIWNLFPVASLSLSPASPCPTPDYFLFQKGVSNFWANLKEQVYCLPCHAQKSLQ